MSSPLLEVDNLEVSFPVHGHGRGRGVVRAVDKVSFTVAAGESLGLVGESGCGKSTTGNAIQGLVQATGGAIRLNGVDLVPMRPAERRRQRRHTQMIFQDPTASLNSRMTVEQILTEPMIVHGLLTPAERPARVRELLDMVGMPHRYSSRLPHEFSGGQRQRIAIARAIAVSPSLIICDEPIAALDVSIRAQILNLLTDLQEREKLGYIFISHDLSAVHHLADRILVMYLGRPVELASREALHAHTRHPYTAALLSALPTPDPRIERTRERILLTGEIPSPLDPPSGCAFRTRCPIAVDKCAQERPEWRDIGTPDEPHLVACHFPLTGSGHPAEQLTAVQAET